MTHTFHPHTKSIAEHDGKRCSIIEVIGRAHTPIPSYRIRLESGEEMIALLSELRRVG